MSNAVSPNLSGPLSSVSWSYVDWATADSVTLTTANTPIVFTGGTLDTSDECGVGTFDALTGLYTIGRSGTYKVFASATFAATQALGAIQKMGLLINGETALKGNFVAHREEGTATTKVRVHFEGVVELEGGVAVGIAFESDTAADTAEVFEFHALIQRIPISQGTGF